MRFTFDIEVKEEGQCDDCPFFDNCVESNICDAFGINGYIINVKEIQQ